jgi:hypothetical protein
VRYVQLIHRRGRRSRYRIHLTITARRKTPLAQLGSEAFGLVQVSLARTVRGDWFNQSFRADWNLSPSYLA